MGKFCGTVTRSVCMGIGLAMAGVAVMVLPWGELSGSIMGMIMALGGAVAVASYLLGGRRLRQKLSLISYVFCIYATAAIILTALCAVLGVKLLGLPGKDYMLFLLLGIVPSHLGHTLYNYLLRFLDAKVIALSTLGESIFASLLALVCCIYQICTFGGSSAGSMCGTTPTVPVQKGPHVRLGI